MSETRTFTYGQLFAENIRLEARIKKLENLLKIARGYCRDDHALTSIIDGVLAAEKEALKP